ncbi:SDR family NAD(P)-dependent oxidoreductase [Loigolactobacillus backii]|uniref:2-deoxy-D-gluconate 3-dehydrogenase n=1 Tax=Loigolactobacillus backii TaxID=375175 RepID=A0A192H0R9_9LACO|nr:SDR family oxidoreductase [Loigolactobacillus backii]ANK61950.1 2-deoxy-D-gluconate 3-dehydrogenase [Loigolactobacillus backii]ANK65434.1 2-deoxy-D-gluconate 3-dehydrogenase [Loigolactobacillus backii]ANK68856.1 2-deoxy-D-gluconate 3-dehydrogenase [Loigolactobacillus backii]MDA5386854.1 SDR family oxidoreductase [Loigolactobacillus backii]MDA5389361.1 SDR family oxidoreductase [Loigolactobacillus backii]
MSDSWLGLEGKVVVVTGAVGGMGTKFTEEYAKQGANIALVDLLEEKTEERAKALHDKYGVDTLAVKCNTTSEKEVDAAVKKVVDHFGQVDVLVNTAAILRFSPLEDLRLDEWNMALNVNLTGYFLMSQRFGRVMIKQHKGIMIHISTIASRFPETYSGTYSTTKAGVNMMSRQIAAEWGQFGVRSNCVLPCLVKTPLSQDFYSDPKVEEGRKNLTASKRIGTLDDIANAVIYLSSDRSDYTNGGELTVEGGFGIMMGDQIPKPGGRREYAVEHHQPAKK